MKKIALSVGLLSLAISGAYAGTMGPVVSQDYFVPFAVGEATVTWNTTQSVSVFGSAPSLTKDLWGGRGAVGVAHSLPSRWGYTAEIGWGYYGSTSSFVAGTSPTGSMSITNSSYLYGFDVLAGLSYDFTPVQIFLKGGAMAENRHVNGYTEFLNTTSTGTHLSTTRIRSIATNVLPEIKVGGLYAFNEHISFTLAYMHVFGNDNFSASVTGAMAAPAATTGINTVANAQNPSLDSVLFGLVYHFV
jgi:hypothetical protein